MEAPRDDLVRSVPFEVARADEDGDGLTLSGYGAVFNDWTDIDSWEGRFRERIAPGAFKRTIQHQAGRIRLQFDHGQHPLIGSLPIGTIRKLKEDARGLFVEARLTDNWLVQPVRDAIRDGSVDGMSFRFAVNDEEWEDLESETPKRTITEVRLMEVGPVVWPAYQNTTVGVRSQQLAKQLLDADEQTRRDVARLITFGLEDDVTRDDDPAPDDGDTSELRSDDDGPPDEGTRQDDSPPDTGHLSSDRQDQLRAQLRRRLAFMREYNVAIDRQAETRGYDIEEKVG